MAKKYSVRITVGHILILGVLGAGGFYFASQNSHWVQNTTDGLKEEVQSLKGLFISGEEEKKKDILPPEPEKEKQPQVSTTTTPAIVASTVPFWAQTKPEPKPAKIKPAQNKPSVKKAKKKKKTVRRKKSKKKRVVRKTKKTPVRKSKKKKNPAQELVGTYVTLELNTGRQVKGILKSVTTDLYNLEMPGMGPLPYLKKDVKNIRAAN